MVQDARGEMLFSQRAVGALGDFTKLQNKKRPSYTARMFDRSLCRAEKAFGQARRPKLLNFELLLLRQHTWSFDDERAAFMFCTSLPQLS